MRKLKNNVNEKDKLIIKDEFLVNDYINIDGKVDNLNRKFYIIIELRLNKIIGLKNIMRCNKLKYI